jgi:hypothetical protein
LAFDLGREPSCAFPETGQIQIVDREINVDGIDLVQLGQNRGLPGPYEIARIHQPPIDAAAEGGFDRGVAEVELGQLPLGLRRHEVCLCRIPLVPPVVYVHLGGGVLLEQRGVSIQLDLGIFHLSFLQQNGRLGLLQVVLVSILLNEEEQLVLFHQLPIPEEDLFQIPSNPGNQLHRIDGLGIAGQFQILGHRPPHRLGDRNRRGRRRRLLGLFGAARLEDKED